MKRLEQKIEELQKHIDIHPTISSRCFIVKETPGCDLNRLLQSYQRKYTTYIENIEVKEDGNLALITLKTHTNVYKFLYPIVTSNCVLREYGNPFNSAQVIHKKPLPAQMVMRVKNIPIYLFNNLSYHVHRGLVNNKLYNYLCNVFVRIQRRKEGGKRVPMLLLEGSTLDFVEAKKFLITTRHKPITFSFFNHIGELYYESVRPIRIRQKRLKENNHIATTS